MPYVKSTGLCTNPFPKLRLPTTTARSKSCRAPATISEADALRSFTKITNGIWVSTGSRCVLKVLLCFSIFDFVVTIVSFFATKRLQIFTASFNNPPGLSLTSRMILSAPSFLSCSSASLVS